jgi:hypothetical protein
MASPDEASPGKLLKLSKLLLHAGAYEGGLLGCDEREPDSKSSAQPTEDQRTSCQKGD